MHADLIKVRDVYGDFWFVSRADYEGGTKTQLPLYFATGRKLYDSPMPSIRHGVVTIHRGNIAEQV